MVRKNKGVDRLGRGQEAVRWDAYRSRKVCEVSGEEGRWEEGVAGVWEHALGTETSEVGCVVVVYC